MTSLPAPGTGYFVEPTSGSGPGVLLLSSSWGLTASVKERADNLADSGFTVLAPDLYDGQVARNPLQAQEQLLTADMNVAASLAQSSLRLLQAACGSADPVGLVGFEAGASWALWLSVRYAARCRAVVAYYGTQSIAFDDATASYLLHYAANDELVSADDTALLGLNLQLARRDFTVSMHDEVGNGFAAKDNPNYNAQADAVAWRQSLEFLSQHLRTT